MDSPSFSIMITTRDRSTQLRDTLLKILSLAPGPAEVLITADGCTDDTVELVRDMMPEALLIENKNGQGSVASRVAMMQRTKCDFVFALDDDSYPDQMDCLAKLREFFVENERVAIATFPQRTNEYPRSLEQKAFGPTRPIRSFPNSGACLRVSTYRQLAGFESIFFHMYEEPDYALQCVASGWDVLYYPEITIRHHWTPNQRSQIRNHHRHARNEFWSTLMRCPFPHAFGLIVYRVLSQAAFAGRRGPKWLIQEPVWWWQALMGIPTALTRRRPVTWQGYKKWLSLPDE